MGLGEIDRRIHDQAKLKEIAKELSDMVNPYGFDYEECATAFAEALYNQHRTLQQSTFRLLWMTMIKYADTCDKYGVDLRNEMAYRFAKKIRDEIDFDGFPFV